jgi:hypothetical protein
MSNVPIIFFVMGQSKLLLAHPNNNNNNNKIYLFLKERKKKHNLNLNYIALLKKHTID